MSKQHAKIIINPAAGAGSTRRKWPLIQAHLKDSGLSFDYEFTESKGHATELAHAATSHGCRYLIAVGGDGTIHEVANGIIQASQSGSSRPTLGMICTGTGSDLARSVGVPHDYKLACQSLVRNETKRIDLGHVEYRIKGTISGRYFLNAAGIGFDATVVEATEKLPKFFGGTIPYLFGLARTFLTYRNRKIVFQVGDNGPRKATVLSVVVANGRYFGGGMHIAPKAVLNDGMFDILTVGDFGKLEILKVFPRVYRGAHLDYPKVSLDRSATVSIDSSQPFLLHADGELLGHGPVRFSIIPGALDLVV